MKKESSSVAINNRYAALRVAQEFYPTFADFLRDGMAAQGFTTTPQQEDIGAYMEHGPHNQAVQAGRGEAKSTIAVCFALYCILHSPAHRIVVVSATESLAASMTTLALRLLLSMPALACLIPDRSAGDKTSSLSFDIHHTLKGTDKSPSFNCFGILGGMTGSRADLMILDDIESPSNSTTATKREVLLQRSLEFGALVGRGRQIWLGTPQSTDSIYRRLASRGVVTRIWPARFPTPEELPNYGTDLAPRIRRLLDNNPELQTGGGISGLRGQATDPQVIPEDVLVKEELGKEAHFNLQYMLNTTQSDALRYPLKVADLIMLPTTPTHLPLHITRSINAPLIDFTVGGHTFKLSPPHSISTECVPIPAPVAYIDPAGGGANGDETAFCVATLVGNCVYVLAIGGVGGGYDPANLEYLAELLAEHKPGNIIVEKNMGHGAFAEIFKPIMYAKHGCLFTEDWASTNKEARIIDTLGPVMGRGSLVFTRGAVDQDIELTQRHDVRNRGSARSVFHQLAFITRQRASLLLVDRVDALAGVVKHLAKGLSRNQDKLLSNLRTRDYLRDTMETLESEWEDRPYGNSRRGFGNIMDRYKESYT